MWCVTVAYHWKQRYRIWTRSLYSDQYIDILTQLSLLYYTQLPRFHSKSESEREKWGRKRVRVNGIDNESFQGISSALNSIKSHCKPQALVPASWKCFCKPKRNEILCGGEIGMGKIRTKYLLLCVFKYVKVTFGSIVVCQVFEYRKALNGPHNWERESTRYTQIWPFRARICGFFSPIEREDHSLALSLSFYLWT